jgi:hypothetical protein
MTAIIGLFCLLIGLVAGFWAKDVYYTIHKMEQHRQDERAFNQAGVVRPRAIAQQPIDLSTSSGGVRRPTPEQSKIAAMKQREERLKTL